MKPLFALIDFSRVGSENQTFEALNGKRYVFFVIEFCKTIVPVLPLVPISPMISFRCSFFSGFSFNPLALLHFLPVLMSLFNDRKLGMGVGDWKACVRRLLCSVQEQRPFLDETLLWRPLNKLDLETPTTTRVLGPRVRCHERPLGEAVLRVRVVWSL